jgi:hypothetical protein
MRQRGLRWLHRHGHLDSVAVHTLDAPDHAGGWSVDASVTIPGWDRHGLERLVRYCARPPLSQERLGRVDDQMLVYSLRKATVDGRTELYLTPLELLDRLASSLWRDRVAIPTDHPASHSQTPLLRGSGPERPAQAGGDRICRTGRGDAASVATGPGKDGNGGGGPTRHRVNQPYPTKCRPLLGPAVGPNLRLFAIAVPPVR